MFTQGGLDKLDIRIITEALPGLVKTSGMWFETDHAFTIDKELSDIARTGTDLKYMIAYETRQVRKQPLVI